VKSAVSALVDERAGANVRHGTEQCTPGGDLPRVRVPGRRARACSVAFEDDFTDSRKGDADSDKVSIYTPCRHSAARNVTLEKLHSTLVSLGSDRELVGGLFRDGNGVPEILLPPPPSSPDDREGQGTAPPLPMSIDAVSKIMSTRLAGWKAPGVLDLLCRRRRGRKVV